MTNKWTLADVAHLAEIVGAVAIVISLIYVGQELKSNTAAVQAASLQDITNATSTSVLTIAENGELADIRFRGDRDPESLTDVERLRYGLFHRQMWLQFQNVWTQWRLGTLDDGVWQGYKNVICDIVSEPRVKKWWRDRYARALSGDFVAVVESCGANE